MSTNPMSTPDEMSDDLERVAERLVASYDIAFGENLCSMLRRCSTQEDHDYRNYVLRGIKVCERWQKFENFSADMGLCPAGLTIDRIDNDKGYQPGNCRWATVAEQNRNQRRTKLSAEAAANIRADTRSIRQIAISHSVSRTMIRLIKQGRAWV